MTGSDMAQSEEAVGQMSTSILDELQRSGGGGRELNRDGAAIVTQRLMSQARHWYCALEQRP